MRGKELGKRVKGEDKTKDYRLAKAAPLLLHKPQNEKRDKDVRI